MRKNLIASLLAILCLTASGRNAFGQNWRQENPDRPNGYRASEAASHYHGNLHMPANQLNGYRASEARSHYGGMRMEPSSGWHYGNDSGPGSAFRNQSGSEDAPGSAFNYASRFHSDVPENSLVQRMRNSNQWQQEYRNLRAAGYSPGAATNPGYCVPARDQNIQSRFSTYMPAIERESQLRQRAIQNIESGGGFNRIYRE
jgi:hypothetical protein